MKEISKNITYSAKHWYYYQREAIKLKVWHPRHLLHDLDKFIFYLMCDKKTTSKIHRIISKHHLENDEKKKVNYLDAIIDWECARYTKADKQLNARETMEKYYSSHAINLIPILNKLGL